MKGIDLFRVYRGAPVKEVKFAREAKVISFVLLIFYCLVIVAFFSYWLILESQTQAVAEQIERQEQLITSYKESESLFIFIKQRLAALSPFLAKEVADYKEVLSRLETIIPTGVTLERVELNEDGRFGISGEAANAVVFATLLESITASKELAKDVELTSAIRDEEGFYYFSFDLNAEI